MRSSLHPPEYDFELALPNVAEQMYFIIVGALMLVLPLLSAGVEAMRHPGSDPTQVPVRWFVFWGASVRFTATKPGG
jgi:hypothetical protein